MKVLALLLLAGPALHFDITDARGKKASGVTIEAADPDADGWYRLTIAKSKASSVIIWPYDGRAKVPDGPEPVPAIVIQQGEGKPLANPRVIAALAAGELLGVNHQIAFDAAGLITSEDAFAKGVGLLYAHRPSDAIAPLARALQERERQLTRFPSEIYPAAMLYGRALFDAGKFDDAATAWLKALKQRPSDPAARKGRAESLIKAGKPEAAQDLL